MDRQTIHLTVNGTPRQVEIEPRTMLLDVLREDLGLTGTKNGCGQGHCGACTVIMNGKAVRSCVTLARRADGAAIETIEGLAQDGELHPLQRAFVDQGAVQCGFCTPGMIMAAKALLDANPTPTEADIEQALKRNLCRCTGYAKIVEAIQVAAGQRSAPEAAPDGRQSAVVGQRMPRPDAVAKVTGAAIFAADYRFPDMLYARVLRSAHPHARVLGIDTSLAGTAPGVVAVLTAVDVPGRPNHGVSRHDWPVLVAVGGVVRYRGDALAVVVAETEAQAEAALEHIAVEYEPLPAILSSEEARRPDAPHLHPGGNLLKHTHVERGDVDAAFKQADVVIEQVYHTPATDHAFLEPEAAVAVPTAGGVTVYAGSQIPFKDQAQIAASLALPLEKVRVVHPAVGGAFGGKEDISGQIHAALAAVVTGRPVKLVYTRSDSLRYHPKRHATTIHYKTGATRDGKLVAVAVEILGDTGAYASLGEFVMARTATHAAGPYDVPNVRLDSYALFTNNPPAGALRGFGVPQSCFACETQMDMLAERLGLDPLELRRRNSVRVGSTLPTGQVLRESVGLLETIERVEQAMRAAPVDDRPADPTRRRGWGVACAFKNVGLGGPLPDSAGADVELTLRLGS
ncbi:MAG: molybdopterin-dependent oxidoreductase, partial [Chloroflexi bacterium]|nr:molybdopterin-dependent oxidoreductase [Chloroflexota bacterium]